MQTILGSGGAIGIPLARELKKYTGSVRLVSRNPVKVNDTDELFSADLKDPLQIEKAVSGSEVVYVTIGFPYNLKVWQESWPPFMKAVIDSCSRNNSRLVFFDNVYMYDRNEIPFMTESSKINPPSRKGAIRKQLREMVLNAAETGSIDALIARAADFYGPDNRNSLLDIMVAANLAKGKKAQVLGNPHKIHTYTYTPDAAMATALLGNTADAFGQEWHLPTTKEKLTTIGWTELIAKELNAEPGIQVIPGFLLKIMGLFVPVLKELPEMMYQNEQDYIFDSSRFENRFGISATKPEEGIRKMVEKLK
jgi:nucleoside-diphosphate-sugar epimerase